MVLPACGEARLPTLRRWLCCNGKGRRGRAQAHQPYARASRDRACKHDRRDRLRPPDYVAKGCGMGRAATLYLLERGVRVTGIDGWGWDAPFIYTMKKYAETGDASLIWEGHRAGRDIGYCHIEKLQNLEALPAKGFMVSCFPVKVRGGSAGWTRAVAIIDA